MRVYNTLTRQKEPFQPVVAGKATMYVCGPTVYKPSHIGHMVGPVIFDTVKRYLTDLGYQVTFVVNITDVDDKIIQEAKKQNADWKQLGGLKGQAVGLKLVDQLGDEQTALAWLAKEKNIDPNTPVRDFRLRDRLSDLPFLHTAAVVVLEAVGLGAFARHVEEWGALQAVERLSLDGLLALWHPPVAN